MTGASLLVRGALDGAGQVRDLAIVDGRIAEAAPAGAEVLEAGGLLAVPRLADAHVHLDKTLLGEPWRVHTIGGTVEERVRIEAAVLDRDDVSPVAVRGQRLLERAVANGTTLLQSHVDVSGRLGVGRVEALLELAARYTDVVDLALVAFPQEGVLRAPGTADALRRALDLGAEAIGGLDPEEFDGDRDGQLDIVFGLAERYGRRVDIHLHEVGAVGAATIRAIAGRARSLGLEGRCAISHGYALGQVGDRELGETASAMAEAGVSLVTSVPGGGQLPPLARLRELGVNVVAASDNVRDSWSPFGRADALERAALAAYASDWRSDGELDDALALVTANPAAALGREQAQLRPGDPADFVLLAARNVAEALVELPGERLVVRRGRVVARGGRVVDGG